MNELMRDEILDQPEAVRRSLPRLREQLADPSFRKAPPARVIFTGSGDSYFAPLALAYAARLHLQAEVYVLPPLEAARYWTFREGDLLVAISISGGAGRTLEAARAARAAGTSVLAITANPESLIGQVSERTITIPFQSRSRQTPHTTDYMTTLLAITALIEALSETHFPVLDELAGTLEDALPGLESSCDEIGRILAAQDAFYFLGAGPHLATAQYAAAKFWEAGGIPAFAFELEEFAHGPHLLVEKNDPLFLIAPEGRSLERSRQMADGLTEIGVDLYGVTDHPDPHPPVRAIPIPGLPEEWSSFVTCLPLQWLCWSVATAKGYDVVRKDGRHRSPEIYEAAHRRWKWSEGGG